MSRVAIVAAIFCLAVGWFLGFQFANLNTGSLKTPPSPPPPPELAPTTTANVKMRSAPGPISVKVIEGTTGRATPKKEGDPERDRINLRFLPKPWFTLSSEQVFADADMSLLSTVEFGGVTHTIPPGDDKTPWMSSSDINTDIWSIFQLVHERNPNRIRMLRERFGIPRDFELELIHNHVTKASEHSFLQLADEYKDDKGYTHHYDTAYSHYLHAFRPFSEHLSVLEVGLGCDQLLAIGSSVRLWARYLPRSRLTMLEFDGGCAKRWAASPENLQAAPERGLYLYVGDAGNYESWNRLLAEDGMRTYDFIVDDGGHTMQQQIITFFALWPSLKRGGVYVIEDLATSFMPGYGGQTSGSTHAPVTTNFIGRLMQRLHAMPSRGGVAPDTNFASPIARVDCFHNICMITKR